jgi:hypothetical protein
MNIWRSSHPATATTQVPRYLSSRGITISIPPTIRVQGALGPYGRHPSGGNWPQMVAVIKHAEHGVVAVQRTFLAIDGSAKASVTPVRMSIGPVKGAAVRLALVAERLLVGEGVETCLSAMQATGIGAWAALGGIAALVLPPEVREVIILCDHDAAGEKAAGLAAQRWLGEGRRVRIAMPPEPGLDFNDMLTGTDRV